MLFVWCAKFKLELNNNITDERFFTERACYLNNARHMR